MKGDIKVMFEELNIPIGCEEIITAIGRGWVVEGERLTCP